MKLYTKEMFLIAAEKCEVSMIDAKHIMQYIDEYVTPIELPTWEDVKKAIQMAKGLDIKSGVWFEHNLFNEEEIIEQLKQSK